ncbi:3D domain-containing protein [uncultured Selenomonas sp.]|uniref:G5 and 3D domain-containing protein n=1 Tax=uncultured Selenomonas sp. TaxID=159275 RepID=UPI0028D4C7BA|nr:3D domain-containing protein [uncultured Selenomonas sp.]
MQLKSVEKFIQTKKNTIFCATLAGMMLFSSGFTMNGFPKNMHRVSVHVDGQTITDMTVQTKPDDIFAKLGVTLGEKDTYEVQTSEDRRRTEISVRRAVPVRISFWGDTQEVMTSARTVGEVMAEYGYNMNEIDVLPGADTPVTEHLDIQLHENAQAAEQRRAREREAERISRGIPRYRAAYTMNASAYLPSDGGGSGITATGIRARRGVVAVDPSVIPLGSRLYIPGYGEAIAADTGGAIVGHTIDLCMESYDEAIQFGRRSVEVYVIE